MAPKSLDLSTVAGRLEWVRIERMKVRSVRQMAIDMDVEPSTAHRYNSGKREPSIPYLREVSRWSGVDLAWIAAGEGTPDGPAPGPGYADGVREALERLEEAAAGLREMIGQPALDTSLTDNHKLLVEGARGLLEFRPDLLEVGPNPLTAAVSFIEHMINSAQRPIATPEQIEVWREFVETLVAFGVYDPTVAPKWDAHDPKAEDLDEIFGKEIA